MWRRGCHSRQRLLISRCRAGPSNPAPLMLALVHRDNFNYCTGGRQVACIDPLLYVGAAGCPPPRGGTGRGTAGPGGAHSSVSRIVGCALGGGRLEIFWRPPPHMRGGATPPPRGGAPIDSHRDTNFVIYEPCLSVALCIQVYISRVHDAIRFTDLAVYYKLVRAYKSQSSCH